MTHLNMFTAKQKERQEGREKRYGSGHRLIRERESTCVYVYTNLGYKGMTLTNNCSYFVCFSFPLIHTHIKVLQRNRINGYNGGSTYLSIYFIFRNWLIWLWKNIKIWNWQAEDPGEPMVRFQRKARRDLYFSWRTGKWMSSFFLHYFYYSIQVNSLDDVYLHWEGQYSLLILLIQMLMSPRNLLTQIQNTVELL